MGSAFDRSPEQQALIADWAPPEIDTTKPHSARMYDYFLDGKTNFPVDRLAAEQTLAAVPHARTAARANRAFMLRAVDRLARLGVRQFLDIGTGIPIEGRNTHDAAQQVTSDARVVYVDNDPIVLAHARALLSSHPDGATAYIDADVHDPDAILADPSLTETLDLDRPLALLMIAILHFVPDEDKPTDVLRRLTDRIPSGSYLALSHLTGDFDPVTTTGGVAAYRRAGIRMQVRSRAEVAALVPDGWELLEPGVELVSHWHPESEADLPDPATVGCYGLLARKR
ncbi:SAM-dependent methyltransferase [Streptomyces sp. SID3343]|uniref:SAM-dependent methyltransferase n=1 Tax=Streptomyces sp. SID3343 TaxID=2690260 RepID=UPI0013703992|nr:SAM-dependent methyltransferase [Streptomyces sp. SID3343]MYW06684.1 SAM-dependent methyltransferase [Streptomyces sp. SID3343]